MNENAQTKYTQEEMRGNGNTWKTADTNEHNNTTGDVKLNTMHMETPESL